MKFRKPFSPITRKITPARYRAIAAAILITLFSLGLESICFAPIILTPIQLMLYTSGRFRFFYDSKFSGNRLHLAGHDEGDARPHQVRDRGHRRDRAGP